MTYAVMSHRMCHLPEVQDDTFDITSQAMSVGGIANRCIPAHNGKTTGRFGL